MPSDKHAVDDGETLDGWEPSMQSMLDKLGQTDVCSGSDASPPAGSCRHAVIIEIPSDSAEARLIAEQLRTNRSRRRKSRPSDGPKRLLVTDVVHLDPTQRRIALQAQLEHLDGLPKQSAFAKHRRRMLRKALQLLDQCACC